jgi:hypothetical protein
LGVCPCGAGDALSDVPLCNPASVLQDKILSLHHVCVNVSYKHTPTNFFLLQHCLPFVSLKEHTHAHQLLPRLSPCCTLIRAVWSLLMWVASFLWTLPTHMEPEILSLGLLSPNSLENTNVLPLQENCHLRTQELKLVKETWFVFMQSKHGYSVQNRQVNLAVG